MNPYREGGPRTPRARRSFDPAYCKRCAAPPSVNDGYTRPARWGRLGRAAQVGPPEHGRPPLVLPAPPNAIAAIETLVRQRSNRTFIMRV